MTSNEQLARALQPELERAGWTLSLGSIAAVLEALDIHRRAAETFAAPGAYAAVLVDMLDRESATVKRYMMYPVTRIELYEFTGSGATKTRTFVAEGDAEIDPHIVKWREQQ